MVLPTSRLTRNPDIQLSEVIMYTTQEELEEMMRDKAALLEMFPDPPTGVWGGAIGESQLPWPYYLSKTILPRNWVEILQRQQRRQQ